MWMGSSFIYPTVGAKCSRRLTFGLIGWTNSASNRGGKAGQPAPHWPTPRLACKIAGRVGPPRKVIAG